ncbi:NAD(P)/FAD-dependent oxidoreductase [Nocardia shimofusensis]|uniref:NAD(P)/FAD-dependent oxidoreductase n=1 Tax=Nocardia shimofusensis TaxID=228596 RepID=UPI000833D800|nr:FAD-binding oxidoreductase [Nocardia shimofusensis]
MTRQVVVVGAGIVGIGVARELADRGVHVTVLDRFPGRALGSTAYAPGFVGLYNDAPVLTAFARASADIYAECAPSGFTRTGGLELATTAAGAEEVARRVDAARSADLEARLLDAARLPDSVAAFVDTTRVVAAGLFSDDGSADVVPVWDALRGDAIARGAHIFPGREVVGLDRVDGRLVVATSSGEVFHADDVVLAGGVWGPTAAAWTGLELPLFPVAHPYVYSGAAAAHRPGPFVRWAEHHTYARVHGDRLGIGSYEHRPVPVAQGDLDGGAGLPWPAQFSEVVTAAQQLLRAEARFAPAQRVNGVFAMTPDNMPFLGRHPGMDGVWIAEAIWVTHAAGAAAALTDALVGGGDLPAGLAVDRFAGSGLTELRDNALRLYNDIYAAETAVTDVSPPDDRRIVGR